MPTENQIYPWMFRVKGEGLALLLSLLLTVVTGWFFSIWNFWLLVGFLLLGLIYVRLQQSQYLGNGIRIHKTQFPEVYEVFTEYSKRLGISNASLYVVQDPYLQAFTLGIGHCTVVLTSSLLEQLDSKELAFVMAHELGHYAAGHTKITTIISPLGGNAFGNFLFSFWNRKAEYSCDRCGLVMTKDIDSAVSALLKISVGGKLSKKIDFQGYLAQLAKATGGSLAASELLVSHPLTTNRIKSLYLFWRDNFVQLRQEHSI